MKHNTFCKEVAALLVFGTLMVTACSKEKTAVEASKEVSSFQEEPSFQKEPSLVETESSLGTQQTVSFSEDTKAALDAFSANAEEVLQSASDVLKSAGKDVQDTLEALNNSEALDAAKTAIEEGLNTASATLDSLKEADVAQEVSDAIQEAKDTLASSQAVEDAKQAITDAADAIKNVDTSALEESSKKALEETSNFLKGFGKQ